MAKKKEDEAKKEEQTAKAEETAAQEKSEGTEDKTKKKGDAKDKKTSSKEKELEKELATVKEAHIRTLAEYDNYRKRSTREKEAAFADSKADCLKELLPSLDNFERALATTDSDFDSFKKGMDMIYTSLMETLKKLGVEAFGEEGEAFDPNFHNAVMHVDDEELAENVIAQVFSKGYKIGDRILREAMVKVAN